MRVFMAMGPGDIVVDHRDSHTKHEGCGETSITFSSQAARVLEARGHDGLLVSHNKRADRFKSGPVETRNVPRLWEQGGGARFHLSRVLRALHLAWMAWRFRADLAIVDSGSAHYFALALFRLCGIPVAVNFHNVRWPQGFEPRGKAAKLLRRLDSRFFRATAVAAMGCSPECARQAREDGANKLPYFGWTAQFSSQGFDPARLPPPGEPFRIAYVGRIERNKGVFDILAFARALKDEPGPRVLFEICGDGSHLDALRAAVVEANLQFDVVIRGRLERPELLQVYANSHAVIVPTRSDFCEGMPLVCAEAALSGRPVITSRLSNALPVIGSMIVEAEPELVPSYVSAIRRLSQYRTLWQSLHAQAQHCRLQFLDRSISYAAAVDALVGAIGMTERTPLDCRALFGEA